MTNKFILSATVRNAVFIVKYLLLIYNAFNNAASIYVMNKLFKIFVSIYLCMSF